ncbi:MAG: 2Fe-2S iron-sulfur cluster-binding protein [Gammaproteobacteria bacterium]
MGTIYVTDRNGTEHRLEGRERASFMEILKYAGLSIEALCSGCCQCSTCHVYVDEAWLNKLEPASEAEQVTLEGEASEVMPNSRLACQIPWREDLDGIMLKVAPPG